MSFSEGKNMKMSFMTPDHRMPHRCLACFLAFCIINLPVWALNISDVKSMFNVSHNSGAPDNTLAFDIAGRGIIEWHQMDVDILDTINTLQFNGRRNFTVLNRVMDSAVNFNGILSAAGGNVLIVSPHGIVVGPQAKISANSFIASGLNIQDTHFLAGDYQFVPFEIDGIKVIGAVTNEGRIGFNADGSPNPVEYAALIGSQVFNKGAILADGELVVLASGDEIMLGTAGSDVHVTLYDTPISDNPYNVVNDTSGSIQNTAGTIVMAAGDTFAQAITGIQDKPYTLNTYTASQRGTLQADTLEIGAANQAEILEDTTTLANEIKIAAKKVLLEENLQSGRSMTINADYDINGLKGLKSGQDMTLQAGRSVQVRDDIVSGAKARIEAAIEHAEGKLYSRGNIIAEEELILMAESVLWADEDQTVKSSNASVKSVKNHENKTSKNLNAGTITKGNAGNLYISAAEDVQIDDSVSADQGGVSVIAENGKIHTGNDTDTLNVDIRGYSDEITDSTNPSGVELPEGDGKAAIVLKSNDTLKLGPDASLEADGFYLSANDDPDNGVDNRPDMMWLADDGTFIGGFERDEGIPSDVAIYAGSETGNVEVATTNIETAQPDDVEYIDNEIEVVSGPATVVFDALDTVTMPALEDIQQQRQAQENNNLFRFRLEVSSRITEWLFQAVQGMKLPYADNPEAVEAVLENDYVLRGAGLDNPEITDGRIWVLENLSQAPVAPLPDEQLPELAGCPAEMQAAAAELGINPDELQLMIQNSMATNPNLQPCEACALLLVSANALQDQDGERFAAMVDIFESLAPADAPYTPEAAASIQTAFARFADEDPQYALANDYIDAFVDYIAVLDRELKTPIGDPMVYTLNKYGEAIMSHPNQNMVSYLINQAQEVQEKR